MMENVLLFAVIYSVPRGATGLKQEYKQKINNAVNYMAVLYAFCLPLSRAGIVFTSLSLILLWIIEGDFKKKVITLCTNYFVAATLILTSYMLLSLFWSDGSIDEGLYPFKRLWYYIVLFVFVTSLKKEFIPHMLTAFISAMFISELLSFGMFFEFWTMKHGTPSDPTPFMNHLEYSYYLCATSALLLVKFLLEKNNNWAKIIYGLLVLTTTINLFIIDGRAGQIAFLLVVLALIIFNMKNKVKAVFIASALLLSMVFSATALSPSFNDRITAGLSELKSFVYDGTYSGSWGARLEFWDIGLTAVKQEPLLGIGIGDIASNLREGKQTSDTIHNVPTGGYHSDFLETIVAGGLVGAILFIGIFVFLWRAKVRDPLVNNMRIIVTVLFIFGLIADNFLRAQFTIVLFTFFVGIVFAQQRYEKTSTLSS